MYAVHVRFEAHGQAKGWLDDRLNASERVGLPWGSLLAFLRLSASPRVLTRPMPPRAAMAVVAAWLELPCTWVPQPTDRHARTLTELLAPEAKSDLVPDAHLAALAMEHGLLLCSTDRDFARFDGLRWVDPLVERHT